ncbi:MAG: AI-2E family transporter [Firmicutes bacterium]|nr:AI-2E family transporter [Bacillota bacterium]
MQRQLLGAALIFVTALVVVRMLLPYAAPFIIAFVAVLILDPMVTRLERYRVNRSLACFALVFGFFAGAIGLISLLLTALWEEINLLQQGSQWMEASSDFFLRYQAFISELPYPLSETGPILAERVRDLLTQLSDGLVRLIAAIPDGLFVWLIAAMSAFFICKDKNLLSHAAARVLPASWNTWMRRFKREISFGVLGYIRIQLALVALSACLTIAFLSLAQIRFAVVLGLLAGLLDLMPGVGPSGVYIPLVIGQVLRGRYEVAAACAAAGLVLFIIRQLWEPQLVRSRLGVHPLATISALYICFRLLGVVGLFLGPLFAIIAQALYQTIRLERK